MKTLITPIDVLLDNAIAVGLLAVIVFTVMAHGVIEPWSILALELMVTGLLLMWAARAFVTRQLTLTVPQPLWPLGGLIALGLVQSIELSIAGVRHGLSLDVEATRGTVMLLICLLAYCLLAANFLTNRTRLEKLAQWLTFYGMALALFAVFQYLNWSNQFHWLRLANADSPFGPFINRNHFAGYMELLLPWPIVLSMTCRWRWQQILYGFAAVLIATAAMISLSRGGMISLFAELILITLLSSRFRSHEFEFRRRQRPGLRDRLYRLGAVAVIMLTIILGVFWLGTEQVINHVATGQEMEKPKPQAAQIFTASRGELWRDGWAVFRRHPLIGAGLGAFETAYPSSNLDRGAGRVTAQAHNDYLQALADGGLIGGALVLWFIIIIFRVIVRRVESSDPFKSAVVVACGAGVFGLLVHSLFDFNLQLPSHALLFLMLSALAWQVGNLDRSNETEWKYHERMINKRW